MFKSVLIANRGAIACRIIRSVQQLGAKAVAVYAEADATSLHVALADTALALGDGSAAQTYLCFEKIFAAAQAAGAEAIHPGYGFLSENAAFAQACQERGLIFIGPTPEHIHAFGLKHTARALAVAEGLPILQGTSLLQDLNAARSEAARIGYPVMLKSTAGGGGIGMRSCDSEDALTLAYASVCRTAENSFGSGDVYLETFLRQARHVEVQIFGDSRGNVVALGERDCSVQRRNQKVIEETPAPGLSAALRTALIDAAVKLGQRVGYTSAGTVEFLVDLAKQEFYFLEVNTRLQVEHGITEEVSGIDLVAWMVQQAAGDLDLSGFVYRPNGVSIQARVYAEDPNNAFRPSAGLLTEATFATAARVDTWIERGTEVSANYDPLLAKIIVTGVTRDEAVANLHAALAASRIAGIASNLAYLRQITASSDFANALIHTAWLTDFPYQAASIDVIEPGTQSSIQDYPGRHGYWAVGIPPSGPMDDYAFRLGNELVGNAATAAGLEITLRGPTLRFNRDSIIALTGAAMAADLDGAQVPYWESIRVPAGSVLRLRGISGGGCRTYLAVSGGFDVPTYLGSKATFSLGKFGGHGGRTLRHGDVLDLCPSPEPRPPLRAAPLALRPDYGNHWDLAVLCGPHAAPDFFTKDFFQTFLQSDWTVHYNSNRLGIRLIGPKPVFSRTDGGEAGLHPSNIHDNEYAVGTINFTGDMPVILAKDGPSLGGFVCPVTIVKADLWKVGQLRPGDRIRFKLTSFAAALAAERLQDTRLGQLAALGSDPLSPAKVAAAVTTSGLDEAILATRPPSQGSPGVVYRQAGDKYILIEYGPLILDLDLRFRVHALMEWFKQHPLTGVIELSPGVRSLQVHFDSRVLPRETLLDTLFKAEAELPLAKDLSFTTRILRLPLAFNASSTKEAIAKYRQSVRNDAPWLPSNVEFIRRINGLSSIDEVEATIFKARYMVLGLGDVYLGAPCAVPIDPRHRLVTTKYNPARTWTAEGEVGIGGVYMCVYGMESPGGYQLVGRTVPVWNTHRVTKEFTAGEPWLLRFFDQVQFYPMAEAELGEFRRAFANGRVNLDISTETFHVRDYHAFLQQERVSIAAFKATQQQAFDAERERWTEELSGSSGPTADVDPATSEAMPDYDANQVIGSPIAGSVWSVGVRSGDKVTSGQAIAVIEAMKMEVTVEAPRDGVVQSVIVGKGKIVDAGQPLIVLDL